MTGPIIAGGRSGKRRTSSFKNSLVDIWRWKGYPHCLTSVSRSYDSGDEPLLAEIRRGCRYQPGLTCSPSKAQCGFRSLIFRTVSIAASRGLQKSDTGKRFSEIFARTVSKLVVHSPLTCSPFWCSPARLALGSPHNWAHVSWDPSLALNTDVAKAYKSAKRCHNDELDGTCRRAIGAASWMSMVSP